VGVFLWVPQHPLLHTYATTNTVRSSQNRHRMDELLLYGWPSFEGPLIREKHRQVSSHSECNKHTCGGILQQGPEG
jgi:hypothetical protein